MRCIRITGRRGCGKSRRARALYRELVTSGQHVVLEDCGQWLNNLPERSMSKADVLITVQQADGDLTETTS